MASSSSSSSNSPCAACKFLRRKCLPAGGCIFAPYFPPDQPTKFVHVHRIFGASNVGKLLSEIPSHQREDAVNSLAYEAEARLKDPVHGCVGAISLLQKQLFNLQKELDATNADIIRYAASNNDDQQKMMIIRTNEEYSTSPPAGGRVDSSDGSGYFDPNSGLFLPYYWSTGGGAHSGSSSF